MVNKIMSILLGLALGATAGVGAYQSQYLRYIPKNSEPKMSDLVFSEKAEAENNDQEEQAAGHEPDIVEPEETDHILREDTIIHYDPDIPYEVQECAFVYGDMYGICPEFLEAVAFAESSYIPDVSNGSCIGLMQINMSCREQLERMARLGLSESDMYEVDASMIVAADYLQELFEEYEDPAEVLMRYNGDRTGLKRYWKTGELSDYAKGILKLSAELERKHGK